MSIGTTAFTAVWNTLADARATVETASGAAIATALCSGIESSAEPSEQGMMYSAPVTLRYLLTDDPADGECEIGHLLTVTMSATGTEREFRIMSRAETAGVLRLTLEAVAR